LARRLLYLWPIPPFGAGSNAAQGVAAIFGNAQTASLFRLAENIGTETLMFFSVPWLKKARGGFFQPVPY